MSLPTSLPDALLAILQTPNPLPPVVPSPPTEGSPVVDPFLSDSGPTQAGVRRAHDGDEFAIDEEDRHRAKQVCSNMLAFVRRTTREPGFKVKSGNMREIENFALVSICISLPLPNRVLTCACSPSSRSSWSSYTSA